MQLLAIAIVMGFVDATSVSIETLFDFNSKTNDDFLEGKPISMFYLILLICMLFC